MMSLKNSEEMDFVFLREQVVEQDLKGRDITDSRVLEAFLRVPREEFVPAAQKKWAYADYPLPIGRNQTISQPYIVALMTQLCQLSGQEKVLEVGTGSGYQAAILAEILKTGQVFSIERVPHLARSAQKVLGRLGYENVRVRVGDGSRGWPKEAPFDAILVTAAPAQTPPALVEQLAPGGRLVIPVGRGIFGGQELKRFTKKKNGRESGPIQEENFGAVAFVPLIQGTVPLTAPR